MATSVTLFRARFVEFASPVATDARVQLALDDAALQLNTTAWGGKYDMGQAYLAAHLIALDGIAGGLSGIVATGHVTSESVGGVSRSYGSTAKLGDSDDLLLTKYGMRFVSLRKQVLAGPVIL